MSFRRVAGNWAKSTLPSGKVTKSVFFPVSGEKRALFGSLCFDAIAGTMPPSAMPSGLPSKTYRSSADNSLSTFSYFMEPMRPVTASVNACHARKTASTNLRQSVCS